MEVRALGADGARVIPVEGLAAALADPDLLVWVDVPVCDEDARALLHDVLGFHYVAVREAATRQHMPKVHGYPGYSFVVLHSPMLGERGHVHYIELDQFVGPGLLVTVHGPTNPAVPAWVPLRDTQAVWERICEGRWVPATSMELSRAIVSAMTREMEYTLEEVTTDLWGLEQRVTAGELGDPETFLELLFQARHALLAVANMTEGGTVVYGRMLRVGGDLTEHDRTLIADTIDQLERVHALAKGQREYLQGVIEFYRARADTKLMIAAERLAVIAAVTLPATAIASVFGMNVIVNERTVGVLLWPIVVVMALMSAALLWWARKHEWW